MVQRKAINKPTFNKASPSSLFEGVKKPSSNTMKPSIQIHDHNKAKGTELAKKMKKSQSFKASLRRHQVLVDDQTPQKKSPIRASSASSPNYMKSTSSSESRKEKKQVLLCTKTPTKSGFESTSKRLFSSPSSSSAKSMSRIASLRKVRTLTNAPSFKPSRSIKSVKKCSKTSLYDVKRNTCSSTMKDSKFPTFLDLNPGATESQGTSIMKVCPYNYCSLNGHRHESSPPLKSFLCARRKMMKAQKSTKPVDVSPCKVKPCLVDDPIEEAKEEFFLEIYANKDQDGLKESLDQEKEPSFNEIKLVEDVVVDESVYDVLSFDWDSSDMEWEEEGRIYLTGFELEDDESDENTKGNEIEDLQDEGVVNKDYVNMEFLKEFLDEELFQDEIVDCHEQLSDSDSSMNDEFEDYELDQLFQVLSAAIEGEKTEEFPAFNKEKTEDLQVIELGDEGTISLIQDMESSEFTKEEDDSKASEKTNKNKKERTKEETSSETSTMITITKGKRSPKDDSEDMKSFNPREPNFLELEPELDPEKVDLKHQEIDERRNSEEWMLDFALRKAVDYLAPARRKKVSLLVAAFETVIPPPGRRHLQSCN